MQTLALFTSYRYFSGINTIFRQSSKKFTFPSKIVSNEDTGLLSHKQYIDQNKFNLLERLSLVDFGTKEGIEVVEDAIRFANQLHVVDTEGVEPLYTVLENESCYAREDITNRDVTRDDLLLLAQVTEEEYYIAPLGNIALIPVDGEALRAQGHRDEESADKNSGERKTE